MPADAPASPAPATPAPRRARRAVLAALLTLPLLAGGLWWAFARRGPPAAPRAPADPRLSYAGPYLNVRPGVGYVGDSACAGCHVDKAESYARHPMARSLAPVARLAGPPAGRQQHNPFDAEGVRFEVVRRGKRLWHREARLDAAGRPVYALDLEVHYVIGSGTRGHSYVTRRDGYLFQTPVSWFAHKQRWDLSPGFGPDQFAVRPINSDCLFCHANRADPVPGYVDRYREPVFDGYAIGCERCHGPGELHVRERTRDLAVEGPADYTIVNPGKLEPGLRESVCQQCHLEGEARVVRRGRGLYDFRPGMPLGEFWAIFVRADRDPEQKAVNHGEQMVQSRCFTASAGTENPLGCVSCHDPHVHVEGAGRQGHYRAACLKCHGEHGCATPRARRLRESPGDSCVDCHMPRYAASDIAHTAATDHTIPRRASGGGTAHRAGDERGGPIRNFFGGRQPRTTEEGRDLALALVLRLLAGRGDDPDLERSAELLGDALEEDAEDVEAWEAMGVARGLQGRYAESLSAFESALGRAPRRAGLLFGAAEAAEGAGDVGRAIRYWRRAVEVKPGEPRFYRGLALLLARERRWDELGEVCEPWLRLAPLSVPARQGRILYLLHTGKNAEAKAEFGRLRRSRPPDLEELEGWFANELGLAGG